ncbi:MAG: outer membrane protein transport protein [Kiritimatiellae bacterium]|nr:outer membrane protein transport protein [Kiritimatiellia bacterium]
MHIKAIKISPVFSAVVIGAIFFCALNTRANEANYQQYVIGDRAAGMGGAGAALGTALDAAYYNPAGLAYTKQRTISVSASLYGWQKYNADDALYPAEDAKTSSFITVPPAMGMVFFAAPQTAIGLGAFVPARYSLSDILAFPRDHNYYNITIDDQTLMIGPSAAHAFSEKWSVGIGIYGIYRNYSSLQTVYLDTISYTGTRNLKYKTFGLLGMAGVQYRPTERWRFGLSAQCPAIDIWGNGEYQANEEAYQDGVFIKDFGHADNMDAKYKIPAKFTVGAGWEKEKAFGIGLDLTWHLANSYNRLNGTLDETGEPAIAEYINRSVVDVNVGAEYYIANAYPIRAGFYTAFSAAPDADLKEQEKGYPGQIDEYGLTASVGRELDNVTMSLGVNYIFGSGDDYGYTLDGEHNTVVQSINTAREKQIYIFFNTSYMF